jgi:hypothetical protein
MVETIGIYEPDNFLAGDYPIAKDVCAVAAGASVAKHAPVKLAGGGIEPVAAGADDAETVEGLYGIAAEVGEEEAEIAVYLTGEFFAEALALETGVTADVLKPAFRNIGIYLKEAMR